MRPTEEQVLELTAEAFLFWLKRPTAARAGIEAVAFADKCVKAGLEADQITRIWNEAKESAEEALEEAYTKRAHDRFCLTHMI